VASRARICASRPGPPTAAASSASGISRPSTVVAACFIEATMIAPESISVPSRSKRTVSYRIGAIVATSRNRTVEEMFQGLTLQQKRGFAGRIAACAAVFAEIRRV
jgi:hypothetical protein